MARRALKQRKVAVPVEYTLAPDVQAIAVQLISQKGGRELEGLWHLRTAKVLYLFTSAEKVGKEHAATAARYPKRFAPLGEFDFVITCAKPIWNRLDGDSRNALVYHELLHCSADEKGNYKIAPHDFEEFSLVVKHFGIPQRMHEQMSLWAEASLVSGMKVRTPAPTRADENGHDVERAKDVGKASKITHLTAKHRRKKAEEKETTKA